MPSTFRFATLLVALMLFSACGPDAQVTVQPTQLQALAPTAAPTAAPTSVPEPTALPRLADDIEVAGVDVGGLTLEDARKKVETALEDAFVPLDVHIGTETLRVQPDDIDVAPALDEMLAEAQAAREGSEVALKANYDQAKLRDRLDDIADQVKTSGGDLTVVSDTKALSATFVMAPAIYLDVDAALEQIGERLVEPTNTDPLTVELKLDDTKTVRPTPEQLQEQLKALTQGFKGVVGVYVHDLATDQELASINKGTAFSTASTIKTAILLNAYAHVEEFSQRQITATHEMIIDSDNLKANDVLAASVGGTSTDSAFEGAQLMSDTLAELGLPTTYQYTPFEANDFIKLYKPKYTLGPKRAGEAPYTTSSRVQRTTPYEMAQLYRLIEQCGKDEGLLVEKFPETLNAERCGEMIDLLEQNADKDRMMSGLPAGTVAAHKSGWAQPEVQGDAGIVRSSGGDFIIAIYVWQPGNTYKDAFVQQYIGNITRLVYSYYNPMPATAE
jgi:beta-lactamase class A